MRLISEVVESLHVDGNRCVQEAATVGLLEDLQETHVVVAQTPARCLAYFGPASRRGWRELPTHICGYRVEEIENPLTRQARYLDKLVDELAKGRTMEKILRAA